MKEKICLENSELLVEINVDGAELSRIFDKKKNREVLWNGDPEVWGRHAPVLFPTVGQCFGQTYRYRGREYPMGQHGFARDQKFTLISFDENEVWYRLEDSEETRVVFPFSFILEIGHRLKGRELEILWKVTNPDTKEELHFQIGGHPGFLVPEEEKGYMKLGFPGKESLEQEMFHPNGFVDPEQIQTLVLKDGEVEMDDRFYDIPTYVFHDSQVEKVMLKLSDGSPYVTLSCKGFPYLAVWSPDISRFHCLEPWFGRVDDEQFDKEFTKKRNILTLKPNQVFEASYFIEIN